MSIYNQSVQHEQCLDPEDVDNTVHTAQDFEKGDVKQFRKACQWYETLGHRMAGSGHCLDVFACSLDQVGIAEMHDAVSVTGEVLLGSCSLWKMIEIICKKIGNSIACVVPAALRSTCVAMICSVSCVTAFVPYATIGHLLCTALYL